MRRRLLIAIIAGGRRRMVILNFRLCVHCDHLKEGGKMMIKNLRASDVILVKMFRVSFFKTFYNPFHVFSVERLA